MKKIRQSILAFMIENMVINLLLVVVVSGTSTSINKNGMFFTQFMKIS
jgi:hypothetical protein